MHRVPYIPQVPQEYQVQFQNHLSKPLPHRLKATRPFTARLPSFDTQLFRSSGESPKVTKDKQSPLDSRSGKPVSALGGAQWPLALPRGCCGAEITHTGRVGWQEPSQEQGLPVNNELPPGQGRR